MKLYNSLGPNPKVVRMFMAELGVSLEQQDLDIMAAENRQPEFMKLNPAGTLPALELDDGSVLSEVTAICEYLAEREGGSSLIGDTPEERAETRMWMRRIDLGVIENMSNGFRYTEGLSIFKDRVTTFPEAGDCLKTLAREKLAWVDGQLAGREFICGGRFSLADVLLFCFVEFGGQVGQPLDEANSNLKAWYERVAARESAKA